MGTCLRRDRQTTTKLIQVAKWMLIIIATAPNINITFSMCRLVFIDSALKRFVCVFEHRQTLNDSDWRRRAFFLIEIEDKTDAAGYWWSRLGLMVWVGTHVIRRLIDSSPEIQSNHTLIGRIPAWTVVLLWRADVAVTVTYQNDFAFNWIRQQINQIPKEECFWRVQLVEHFVRVLLMRLTIEMMENQLNFRDKR